MIKHIVMWKLKDQAEDSLKDENALKIKSMLEGLKQNISGIKTIEVGIDMSRTDSSFDVVLYSEFEDRGALEQYMNHPDHQKVADFIGKVRTERIVVDYEI